MVNIGNNEFSVLPFLTGLNDQTIIIPTLDSELPFLKDYLGVNYTKEFKVATSKLMYFRRWTGLYQKYKFKNNFLTMTVAVWPKVWKKKKMCPA
jgi:hypothetical protein